MEYLPNQTHDRRIQVFRAQPVVAGIAFNTFVAVYGGAIDRRVHINSTHGADIGAVSASYALIRIDLHHSVVRLADHAEAVGAANFAYHITIDLLMLPLIERGWGGWNSAAFILALIFSAHFPV
jgi:hypothetical protein